jgi:hypothetical protein
LAEIPLLRGFPKLTRFGLAAVVFIVMMRSSRAH